LIFLDVETCGFHGPATLIQWATLDGEIQLHDVWCTPIQETLDLIYMIVDDEEGIVGFNLAFDWFHICQLYTMLVQFPDPNERPIDHIDELAIFEEQGRFGDCLKPVSALDLMLHARKGPYQGTMNRSDVKVKKVPTALAWEVAKELDARIPLKDVYFARKQDVKKRWQVMDITDDFGDIIPDFKNIVLKFAPSSALKALAADALGYDTETIRMFTDIELPTQCQPTESGYAPFALAHGKPGDWNWSWPDVIRIHMEHWLFNESARKYASDDVKYTRELYHYFGKPALGDNDSILACMVGTVRWRGFAIDVDGILKLKKQAVEALAAMPHNFNSPVVCRTYLEQVMDETERLNLSYQDRPSTRSIILEDIANWTEDTVCPECKGMGENDLGEECSHCSGGLVKSDIPHKAARRAQLILDCRHAKKEIELYDKLLKAGRFHASFKVIGTLSSRMAGADGLNPQGIKHATTVRECFPLADCGLSLCGGDFAGFEVCLADAVYGDPDLHADLVTGKKIHGLFGQYLFPPMTYDEILATKGLPDNEDKYARSKNGVFALLYGGQEYTLSTRVGIPEEIANEAYQRWINKYKVWGKERAKIFDMFCSMRQPGGIGTKVTWAEPSNFIESMFGFKRYFTLENQICKVLFKLAEDPPKHWTRMHLKVTRRDRVQTASGAVRSALFASAFALQAANMRAAANHVIQSSGATITKLLQKNIWDLQPIGISEWLVQPLNIHDEIMCPTKLEMIPEVRKIVDLTVSGLIPKVPLLEIEWGDKLETWASK